MLSKLNSKQNLLSILVLCIFVFLAVGSTDNEEVSTNTEEINDEKESKKLSAEKKKEIKEWVDDATMYELEKLKMSDNEHVTVWIELEDEAISDSKDYTNGLTNRIAELYNYEQPVSVTAMQNISGSDKIRAFGQSIFSNGKTEYKSY